MLWLNFTTEKRLNELADREEAFWMQDSLEEAAESDADAPSERGRGRTGIFACKHNEMHILRSGGPALPLYLGQVFQDRPLRPAVRSLNTASSLERPPLDSVIRR